MDFLHPHAACLRLQFSSSVLRLTNMPPPNRTKDTNYYMGPIHPRDKKPVAARLAQAALVVAYGAQGSFTGPTLAGCRANGENAARLAFLACRGLTGFRFPKGGGLKILPWAEMQISSVPLKRRCSFFACFSKESLSTGWN